MQDTSASSLANSPDVPSAPSVSAPTPLAEALGGTSGNLEELAGARSFPAFSVTSQELSALIEGAGTFDLGYRGQIAVGSADRVRWLNGMLTNNVQSLSEGTGNYSFVLNAQGRIQGDCDAFSLPDHLLVLTDRSQVPALMAHFDRFIIMDDVALEDIFLHPHRAWPRRPTRPAAAGCARRHPARRHLRHSLAHPDPHLRRARPAYRRLPHDLTALRAVVRKRERPHVVGCPARRWRCALRSPRCRGPARARSHAALRHDLNERDLPQETSQTRALHFAKGCYLGQEIVERIRSRGAVHRRLAQFTLSAEPAALPLELTAPGDNRSAGRITSTALYNGSRYGFGIVRTDAVERHPVLDYSGGTATLVTHPPLSRTATQPL